MLSRHGSSDWQRVLANWNRRTTKDKENGMSKPEAIKIDNVEYVRKDTAELPCNCKLSPVQIVVADRGWVFVGYTKTADDGTITITHAQNIRKWGTAGKAGLGYLAANGPTKESVLDAYGTVMIPGRSVCAVIDVVAGKWTL